MQRISRRRFVALAAGAAAAPLDLAGQPPTGTPTAQEVVDRIRRHAGVTWPADTVDTFKAGEPSTRVTGIVTTALATMAVLRRAVERGANFVITAEPTFYSRADGQALPAGRGGGPAGGPPAGDAGDPVLTAKLLFLQTHGLVVWRFSDGWRRRRPDPAVQGLAEALGWSRHAEGEDPSRVTVPSTRLDVLASHVERGLNARGGVRVVGPPEMRVARIALLPGTTPLAAALQALPGVDAIVAGEVREWETVEYARDAVTAAGNKALILAGRIVSEDPGMGVCARWLETIVPEVRSAWMAAGDPYWRPL